MSVVPMKLITLAGPIDQFDRVVRACVAGQQFQPEHALPLMQGVSGLRPCDASNPYSNLLRRAQTLAEQAGVVLAPQEFSDDTHSLDSVTAYLDDLEARLGALIHRRESALREAEESRAVIHQLENLHGLSANLEELRSLQYLRFRYGYLPRETYDSFQDDINARSDIFFFPTNVKQRVVYGVYFTTKAAHDEVDSLFNSLHFTRIMIDARADGTADDAMNNLTACAENAEHEAAGATLALAALQTAEGCKLCAAAAWLNVQSDLRQVRRYAAHAKETFYLMGWVPCEELPPLTARLSQFSGLSIVTDDARDITAATPPTLLKNSFFGRIFEPFLRMYGLPAYNELDPSLFMAITYTLFFGIMFGDVGQGLSLAAIGLILTFWKKMWLGNIITCCGLSGAVFGCVYGSVFGFEDVLPGFKILEGGNVTTLLMLSLGLGVVMLTLSMALNIANGVRQKNYDKILFGPNGLAGMVFYLGLLAMVLCAVTGIANLMVPAYTIPVLVLPLVLILLREPLSQLLARDPAWKSHSIGGILGAGFFELFETLLSYLTSTLSFLRIAAYAITHVGLMLVVQMLAGSGNPVVIVLGNLFVMGFEGLLVGIQVLRLEFYELFGRFYSDGGIDFKPAAMLHSKH